MFTEKMTSWFARLWREVKLQRRRLLRWSGDWREGQTRLFSRKKAERGEYAEFALPLIQPIMPGPTLLNKLNNIGLAIQKIDQICLKPGQILSFWAVVGRPSAQRGFRPSRNLVNGEISEAVGGGLCQVSGILYHLALISGLHIVERHPHSLDIYREEERFSPLGADAAVVYGYKDLQVQNPFGFPVVFSVRILEQQLVAELRSSQPIRKRQIEFQRSEKEGKLIRQVIVYHLNDEQSEILCQSSYQIA
jgi:vancomycin resistance protein VanW